MIIGYVWNMIVLSHTFERSNISNKKPSILGDKTSISIEKLGFLWKNPVFQKKNFELLELSYIEFEILIISRKIPSASKACYFN